MNARVQGSGAEKGFSLAALITFMTVMSVLLAVALPVYTTQARRELEEELVFRGEEYVRAIQKYQRQFGVYPPDLDALLESNQTRFLRREYLDPITGEGFRLIKANPNGTLEGSRIYEYEDLPLFGGPLGTGDRGPGGAPPDGSTDGGGSETRSNPFGSFGQLGSQTSGPSFGGSFGGQGNSPGGGPAGFAAPSGAGGAGAVQGDFSGFSATGGNGLPGFSLPGAGRQQGGNGLPGFGLPQGGGPGAGLGPGGGGQGRGAATGDAPGDRTGRGSARTGQGALRGTLAGGLIGGGRGGDPQGTEDTEAGFGGAGATGQTMAITGIVGVAPNNEAFSLKVYNERDIYAEWEFIALPTTLAGAGGVMGLMPGGENNSGQPSSFEFSGN